jgi:hypothetical protein
VAVLVVFEPPPIDPGLDAEGVMDLLGMTGLVEGSGIDLAYDDTAGTITITSTSSGADGLGPDGDKGDITVGGGGTTLTIDDGAVTYAKIQNVSQDRLLGRGSGTGIVGEIPCGLTSRSLLAQTSVGGWRSALSLVPGTDVQAQDAELQAIAGLTSAADRVPYFTGSGTASLMTVSALTRTMLDNTTIANWQTDLGLLIGTDVAPARRLITADTTTAFSPLSTHENRMITLSNAAAITVTLPSNATAVIPIGAEIDFLWLGVGQPTFVAGSGATVNGTPGLKLRARYSAATAKKIATNDWVVIGDLSA